MKTVKPLIAILLLTLPCFASVHYVSQTLKPTAKLAVYPVKKATFPIRHPFRTGKGVARGTAAVVKTVF